MQFLSNKKSFLSVLVAVAGISLISASCNIFQSAGLNGVLKTIDGGQTWIASNAGVNGSASISGLDVSDMAFDSVTSQTIYLSSIDAGLWQSQDAGGSWRQILSKIIIYDFYVSPTDSKTIYAVGTYNGHGKIVRSEDGGVSWTELYNEASNSNSVNTIAVNPINQNTLYAGLNDGTILQSIDGGINWEVVNTFADQILKLRYDHSNNLYAFLRTKGLQESIDGGKTWNSIVQPLATANFYNTDTYQQDQVSSYLKVATEADAPGIFFVTTNRGLYKTLDNGKHWSFINLPLNNQTQRPRAIAIANNGMLVYTSVGSTIYRSIDGGNSWQSEETPAGNLINKILIDPHNTSRIYAGLIKL